MFELSFVKKYLTPRKKQLSVSLIGMLSIAVITLVVWLIVVFLSVTEGIERTWLNKLTAMHAPVRLQPTREYFSSYYYNVDRYSAESRYLSKTIGQKARALLTDPYNPEMDVELPHLLNKPERDAHGKIKDPVKDLVSCLEELKFAHPSLTYQDMEMSGALLRLDLLRQEQNVFSGAESKSQLTNVSFLASFTEKNPSFENLILPPTVEDLNHLLFLSKQSIEKVDAISKYAEIKKLKTRGDLWRVPLSILPEKGLFKAEPYVHQGEVTHLIIADKPTAKSTCSIERRGGELFFKDEKGVESVIDAPLFSYGKLDFSVQRIKSPFFTVKGKLQNHQLHGDVELEGLEVTDASFTTHFKNTPVVSPLWSFFEGGLPQLPEKEGKRGILLAKNFRDHGVRMGDAGYFAYTSPTVSGAQELHVPVYVCGFYDPGVMSVGNKLILVPQSITQAINSSDSTFTLERTEANQLLVWFTDLKEAPNVKSALVQKLRERGIDKYWTVQTYHEYDFAKDLLQQFESDKYLFSLIGVLILLVGCTNIISLLVILVTDKKKEIGILLAMGARRRSIAAIFALSGASLGLFSCLLGVSLAFLTLRNIDMVVNVLSLLQGHQAFNAQFFGQSLPREITPHALLFAAIATPAIALLAGLFPAIKAARLSPCDTLRSS